MIQHKSIPNDQLHEVKGASTATSGMILKANGDGTAGFFTPPYTTVKMGFWDYNDSITATTPIALSPLGTFVQLTNSGGGAQTQLTYGLPITPAIWNTATNYLNFNGLSLGDTVDIRIDMDVITTTANCELSVVAEYGIGVTPYTLTIGRDYFKTTGTYPVSMTHSLYIGNVLTKDSPARLLCKSDVTGTTVKVKGWFIKATSK